MPERFSGNRTANKAGRGFVLCLVSLIVISGLVTVTRVHSLEPVYAGKRITEWLDGGYEPAAMALQEIGLPAVPWVFQTLRRDHPRWDYEGAYAKVRQSFPAPFVDMLPLPKTTGFDELRAANLLIGIGPPVLPALRAGLKDSNPAVRTACLMALGTLEPKRAAGQQQSP
jgi:HEAT repeat protein